MLVTEIEDEDGILTGKVRGPILWGPGKAQAVREFAAERGVDLAESYAYGNGREDVPYLEEVGRPHPLNPDLGLTAEAAGARLADHAADPRQPAHPHHRGPHRRVHGRAGRSGSRPGWGCGLLNRDRRTGAHGRPPRSPRSCRWPRPA